MERTFERHKRESDAGLELSYSQPNRKGAERYDTTLVTRAASMSLTRRHLLTSSLLATAAITIAPAGVRAAPNHSLTEVADAIFVSQGEHALQSHENLGDISNSSVVVGSHSVAVIDTGGSAQVGAGLLNAIRVVTDKPVRYVINTHMHPDHVFGNAPFQKISAEFIGHHKLPPALQARSEHYLKSNIDMMGEAALEGTKVIVPTRLVRTELKLDLGDRALVCRALPTAHTDNDLVVHDIKTDTLITGDVVFNQHIPTLDGSILGWRKVLKSIEAQRPALVVPGHGPAALQPGYAFSPVQRYLDLITDECRSAIAEGRTLADAIENVGQSERANWQMFDQYHKRNVAAAYAELEWE